MQDVRGTDSPQHMALKLLLQTYRAISSPVKLHPMKYNLTFAFFLVSSIILFSIYILTPTALPTR